MSREQDRAIARLLGYTVSQYGTGYMLLDSHGNQVVTPYEYCGTEAEAWTDCPHFSSDIAAAYAMETVLQQRGLALQYTNALMEILADTYGPDWSDFHMVHATPEQRVAAAIVVLGEET